MSYDQYVDNYVVKFKDEESYLNCRLEYITTYSDVNFINYLLEELYDKDKCEVESIETLQEPSGSNSQSFSNLGWDLAVNSDSTAIGYYITSTGVESGTYTDPNFTVNYNITFGEKPKKEEPPNDPIDNRFDILDL